MASNGTHDTFSTARPAGLFRAVLAAGAVLLLWKAARGLRDAAWVVFGLGVAAYWSGFWPF